MREAELQDKIRLALGTDPALCLWRNNCGSAEIRGRRIKFGIANPGGADLLGVFRGRFVAIEIKTETGRLTEDQCRFRDLVLRMQGEYVVLRSVEEAAAWLADMHRRYPA